MQQNIFYVKHVHCDKTKEVTDDIPTVYFLTPINPRFFKEA